MIKLAHRFFTFAVSLCAILLWAWPTPLALAHTPEEIGGVMVLPGMGAPVQLRAQIIEVTLELQEARPLARVDIRLLLDTTAKQPQSIDLWIQGDEAGRVPSDTIALWANDRALPLRSATPPNRFRSQVSLVPGRQTELRLSYVQMLPPGPVISFRYDLAAADAWPTTDGSARIQVRLPEGVPRAAWVLATPSTFQYDGRALTWHFEQATPDTVAQVRFVHPDVWREIATPVADPGAADARMRQAELLLSLAASDAPDGPAFARFYPVALAYIEEIIQREPERPEPHLALARLYLLNRDAEGNLPSEYAALIVAEAQAAAQAGASDAQVAPLLIQAYRQLLDRARSAGDWSQALAYLDQLRALGQDAATLAEERQALLLNLVESHLQNNRWQEAARLIRDTWNISDLDRLTPPPWLEAAVARVETRPGERTITVQMYPAPGRDQEMAEQVRRAVEALRAIAGTQATASESGGQIEMRITIPLANTASFLMVGQALNDALPPSPEWAFLKQLVRPKMFRWEQERTWLRQRMIYEETVDLGPSVDLWRSYAEQVEREAQRIAAGQSDPAASLIRALGRKSASAWRELGRRVQAHYVLYLAPPGIEQEPRRWLVLADEQRQLMARTEVLFPWLRRWLQ